MSTTTLDNYAQEKSTYVVSFTFVDEAQNPVTPSSVSWSLTNGAGVIMNNLSGQSETPATTINVVLKGDDLQVGTAESTLKKVGNRNLVRRHFIVEASYDSVTYGSGLPLTGEAVFYLEDLKKIT